MRLRHHIRELRRLPKEDQLLDDRIALLEPADRVLLQAVLMRGQSSTAAGRMLGEPGRTVRGRVHRLCRRMASRQFMYTLQALPFLSPSQAALARLHFCAGLSLRRLARRFGLSLHTVRRRLDSIRAEIDVITRLRREGRGAADAWESPWKDGSVRPIRPAGEAAFQGAGAGEAL